MTLVNFLIGLPVMLLCLIFRWPWSSGACATT